jgi:hypothetical protein
MLPDAWERRLVDMNIQPLKLSDIKWADVIFASAMLVQKDSLRRVVELCKAAGKRVVIGGPYVTTGAERLPQADTSSSARPRPPCLSSFVTWSVASLNASIRPPKPSRFRQEDTKLRHGSDCRLHCRLRQRSR